MDAKHCYDYPRPAVTVDLVVFARDIAGMHVLLIRRGKDPFKDCWAIPGGFLNEDEETSDAACRELLEETGYRTNGSPKLIGVFSSPQRDPRGRVVTVAYAIEISYLANVEGRDDAAEARWFKLQEVRNGLIPLAFDHAAIISQASSEWAKGRV